MSSRDYPSYTIPQALINENHTHLVNMGVSHASLENIRSITAQSPFELSTKLTGAGGGGCAVTLIPDGMFTATDAPVFLGTYCLFLKDSNHPCFLPFFPL